MASLTGDQFKYEIMQLIRNSFLNQNYHFSNYWDVTELETVRNLELETQYKVKRNLMLNFGRSNEETAEVLLMDCYKNVEDVKFVSLNGLQCGRHTNSFLGNGGKGVTIGKHADILLRSFYNDGHDQCWIVLFKAILGRQKEVLPIQTPPFREPAQDADCHVSLLAPAPNEDALHVQEIKAQVFIYDKDEDGEFLRRPRQCLPIAYVMLRRAPLLLPLQPIAIRDKAPNDVCNNHTTTKGSLTAQVDGIVRSRRGTKAKGKRREKMAWHLIPVDAKTTSQQKLLKTSNRQKIAKPGQKRTPRKSKETKDPAAAAAAAAAQNKRVAVGSLQKRANSKCTTTDFCRSPDVNRKPSKQENGIGFEITDKSRLSKIPLIKCSQEQMGQHLSAADQSSLVVAKTASWSTAYKPDPSSATAFDPRRRKESAAVVSTPNADDFSLRSPSNDSVSAAPPLTSDDRAAAAAPKTPSGGRRTCLIDALPMSPSVAPSASLAAAAAAARSKLSVAGKDVSKTTKAPFSPMQSTFVSRTVTGIDPRTTYKQNLGLSSTSHSPSNASARQLTALRSTSAPSSTSSSSSSLFQADVSSKSRDIPNAQRASDGGETHSDANSQCTEAAESDKRRTFPLLPPPLLPPSPSKSSPLLVVSENQSTVELQFSSSSRTAAFVGASRSGAALRFPAQNEAQVVDFRNFSFDGSCGASNALVCSTISMRTEFRRDPSSAVNGQLNMHASHSTGQSNQRLLLHGLGGPPMALQPTHHSVAPFPNESHQQQQQQQKLLMLQRGFISSITKQLASDLNDVANVLRNSKQQQQQPKAATEAEEKTASGYLREINCRFMELGPVCAQYKQLFRSLPSDAPSSAAAAVSLPDCQRLYEHEQILKNCCDILGRAFGELKSHHLHQNPSEQRSRTYAWLLSKKAILCQCIDALKRVLDNVVFECAPSSVHRDIQNRSSVDVISDKTSCASLKPCSGDNNDIPVTSSSGSCLTIGRDPKAISDHPTTATDIETASFDCRSKQTLGSVVKVGSKDSTKAFDRVEFNRSQGIYCQRKSLLGNGFEPEEKEQRKEQERELEISSTEEERTTRKCDDFIRAPPTEPTSEGEEGNGHRILRRSKPCNASAELNQISLDFNANESLRSDVSQGPRKEQSPEAAQPNAVDSAMKTPYRNAAETEEGPLLDANAATDRCLSVEPNPDAGPVPIPLEHGASALISLARSSFKCVARDLPIVKIEREDGQDGVCRASQPSHTIIFDADDFSPSDDMTGADAAHLTWEKKPIPVTANPSMEMVRSNDEGNGSRVAVKGTMEVDDIPPPLLTPSCVFDPKALFNCVKYDEDEPPVLESNENPAVDRNAADDRSHSSAVECNGSPTAGPVTQMMREFQASGCPGEVAAGKLCFGRIVGEMILPKEDVATNESSAGDKSVSGDFKGLVTCLAPRDLLLQSVGGQFDCGYDLRFKDEDDDFETPFVLTIKPDEDFDPDSVCFLESQTTDDGGHVDVKSEFVPNGGPPQQRETSAASGPPLIAQESLPLQMDPVSTEPVSEEDHRVNSNDASDGTSDRPEGATGRHHGALPSSSDSPRRGTGDLPAPLSVCTSTSMTVFSESPESPSPESNAVCPTFHSIISAAAAAARSEVQLRQQTIPPSKKRQQREKDVDQKPVAVKAKEEEEEEEECSATEEEKEYKGDEVAASAAKRSYAPSWSLKMPNCSAAAAAGQELRSSFARFVAFQSSLLSERLRFKAKSESKNRTEKSFVDEEEEKRVRDENLRLDHDPGRKVEGSDGSRRSRRRGNSGGPQDSWHRRSSKTSSRGTEVSEYEIKHLEILGNERKPNRWSSDRSSNPRRGCSSKDVSSPDRTRSSETRQQQRRDSVKLRSPFGRTDRRLSPSHRSRDDYARRRTTHCHFGGSEETRWRRSEVRGQGHRRVDCGRRCDEDRSSQRISDPSKLKRQFWSRGHPRFRCHDGCGQCPPATDDADPSRPTSGPSNSSSSSTFLPHSRNRNDILEETLLVNLRATRTDVNLLKDEEEEDRELRRRRTVKREREEEEDGGGGGRGGGGGGGGRRSKASSSNHGSEQDAKKRKKSPDRRSKEEEEDRTTARRLPIGKKKKDKKEKSRTPSSSTADQPMTPASSSNCGSDYTTHLPRRTTVDDDGGGVVVERTPEDKRRLQTRFDQVAMLLPMQDAGVAGARPGVAPWRVVAPTYVTEVLKTKNFSTEVSFERFKS